jgi:intraflagellar transport protein 172
LGQTLKHLAEICIQEDNFKAAETHYVKAGLWPDAVEMYVNRGLWEDAHRVARNSGGVTAGKNVIFKWSAVLAPDTAVKLLNKFGYIYDCIDHLCLKGNVSFELSINNVHFD